MYPMFECELCVCTLCVNVKFVGALSVKLSFVGALYV